MPYERLNLVDGEVLTAEHIRHLEDGIEEAMNSGGGGAGLPTGGTAGQVLTIGSDGNPVWADVTSGGGSIPSVEGVTF